MLGIKDYLPHNSLVPRPLPEGRGLGMRLATKYLSTLLLERVEPTNNREDDLRVQVIPILEILFQ